MKRFLAAALFAAVTLATVAPAVAADPYDKGGAVSASSLCSAVVSGFPIGCAPDKGDKQLAYETTSNTLTQVLAAPAAGSYRFPANAVSFTGYMSATGGVMKLVQGTGSNCASNAATIYSVFVPATTVVNVPLPAIIVKATYALCISFSAGTLTDAGLYGNYLLY